jgi:3-oxoacyl-[acyl-carrier-protein] synthase-3
VVLQPEGPNSGEFGYGRGLLAFDLGADGRLGEALIVPAGGSRLPASMETVERRLHTLRVDAERFVPWAQHAFRGTVRTTLRRSGLRPEEIDLLVVHQAGPPDLPLREETLGFPAQRTLRTAETCGNAGAASLPIALDQARQDGRLQTGDRVLLVGLGGGLTWASAIVGW